jgi:uncharacterized membrane protein YbaN (DUF454 family)
MLSLQRCLYIIIAIITLALGIVGVFLPILPTTPFLIITLWAASKSSPRLEAWLINHKTFGPPLKAWRTRKAIPRLGKWLACIMMTISWCILLIKQSSPILLVSLGALFLGVGIYIVTRPTA